MLKFAELKEVVRQSDQVFVNGLNNVSLGTVVESIERLLKAKFIDQYDKKFPHNILHMHPENAPIVLRNQTFLSNLPGERYSIEANDKIPDDFRYPFFMIQATQIQKQTNTGGFARLRHLKIGAKAMLTVNIYIQNGFINGQVGEVVHIGIAQSSV